MGLGVGERGEIRVLGVLRGPRGSKGVQKGSQGVQRCLKGSQRVPMGPKVS